MDCKCITLWLVLLCLVDVLHGCHTKCRECKNEINGGHSKFLTTSLYDGLDCFADNKQAVYSTCDSFQTGCLTVLYVEYDTRRNAITSDEMLAKKIKVSRNCIVKVISKINNQKSSSDHYCDKKVGHDVQVTCYRQCAGDLCNKEDVYGTFIKDKVEMFINTCDKCEIKQVPKNINKQVLSDCKKGNNEKEICFGLCYNSTKISTSGMIFSKGCVRDIQINVNDVNNHTFVSKETFYSLGYFTIESMTHPNNPYNKISVQLIDLFNLLRSYDNQFKNYARNNKIQATPMTTCLKCESSRFAHEKSTNCENGMQSGPFNIVECSKCISAFYKVGVKQHVYRNCHSDLLMGEIGNNLPKIQNGKFFCEDCYTTCVARPDIPCNNHKYATIKTNKNKSYETPLENSKYKSSKLKFFKQQDYIEFSEDPIIELNTFNTVQENNMKQFFHNNITRKPPNIRTLYNIPQKIGRSKFYSSAKISCISECEDAIELDTIGNQNDEAVKESYLGPVKLNLIKAEMSKFMIDEIIVVGNPEDKHEITEYLDPLMRQKHLDNLIENRKLKKENYNALMEECKRQITSLNNYIGNHKATLEEQELSGNVDANLRAYVNMFENGIKEQQDQLSHLTIKQSADEKYFKRETEYLKKRKEKMEDIEQDIAENYYNAQKKKEIITDQVALRKLKSWKIELQELIEKAMDQNSDEFEKLESYKAEMDTLLTTISEKEDDLKKNIKFDIGKIESANSMSKHKIDERKKNKLNKLKDKLNAIKSASETLHEKITSDYALIRKLENKNSELNRNDIFSSQNENLDEYRGRLEMDIIESNSLVLKEPTQWKKQNTYDAAKQSLNKHERKLQRNMIGELLNMNRMRMVEAEALVLLLKYNIPFRIKRKKIQKKVNKLIRLMEDTDMDSRFKMRLQHELFNKMRLVENINDGNILQGYKDYLETESNHIYENKEFYSDRLDDFSKQESRRLMYYDYHNRNIKLEQEKLELYTSGKNIDLGNLEINENIKSNLNSYMNKVGGVNEFDYIGKNNEIILKKIRKLEMQMMNSYGKYNEIIKEIEKNNKNIKRKLEITTRYKDKIKLKMKYSNGKDRINYNKLKMNALGKYYSNRISMVRRSAKRKDLVTSINIPKYFLKGHWKRMAIGSAVGMSIAAAAGFGIHKAIQKSELAVENQDTTTYEVEATIYTTIYQDIIDNITMTTFSIRNITTMNYESKQGLSETIKDIFTTITRVERITASPSKKIFADGDDKKKSYNVIIFAVVMIVAGIVSLLVCLNYKTSIDKDDEIFNVKGQEPALWNDDYASSSKEISMNVE